MVIVLALMLLFPGAVSMLILLLKKRFESTKDNEASLQKLTSQFIIRNYMMYTLLIATFAIGFVFIADVLRSFSFAQRISNFEQNFTIDFIVRYSAVALGMAAVLPFIISILIRLCREPMGRFFAPLSHFYKSNKERPVFRITTTLSVIAIVIVMLVGVQHLYTRFYAPIILSISPNEINQNPNISGEIEIVVEGVHLSLDTVFYVNNQRISRTWETVHEEYEERLDGEPSGYEYGYYFQDLDYSVNDYSQYDEYIEGRDAHDPFYLDELFFELSFYLPPELFEPGEVSIVAVNNADGIIPARSNELILNVLDVIRPEIQTIDVTTFPDMTALLRIYGENFEPTTSVVVNGQVQAAVIVEDEWGIVASINLIAVPLYSPVANLDELEGLDEEDDLGDEADDVNPFYFVVHLENLGEITSNEYILTDLPRIDESQTIYHNSDWLNRDNVVIAHFFSEEGFFLRYREGFRLLEFSTRLSSDGVLFGITDAARMPHATFAQNQNATQGTLITFEDMLRLMLEYDDVYLITNTGGASSFHALYNMFSQMVTAINDVNPSLINRIIVQIQNPQTYYFISNSFPFTSYILDITSALRNTDALEFLDDSGVPAVIMPISRGTDEFLYALNERNVAAFARATNDRSEALDLIEAGFRGVQTFALAPRLLNMTDSQYENYTLAYTIENNHSDFRNFVSTREHQIGENLIRIIHAEHFIDHYEGNIVVNARYIPENLMESFLDLIELETTAIEYATDSGYLMFDGYRYDISIDESVVTYIEYDRATRQIVRMVTFDPRDNFARNNVDIGPHNNTRYFVEFMSEVQGDGSIVILSVRDEASNNLNDEILAAFAALGFEQSLYGRGMYSYAAIIDGGEVIFESLSDELITHAQVVDRWLVEVTSAGRNVGDYSSIVVNGTESSLNGRGINIVVFSRHTGVVEDSITFDTHHDTIGISRERVE